MLCIHVDLLGFNVLTRTPQLVEERKRDQVAHQKTVINFEADSLRWNLQSDAKIARFSAEQVI